MVGKTVSVRLDNETYKKLQEIKMARGLNESDAVRQSILGAVIVPTGDSAQLSKEFCRIRVLLEKETCDEELKQEVKRVCQSIADVLQRAESLITYLNG